MMRRRKAIEPGRKVTQAEGTASANALRGDQDHWVGWKHREQAAGGRAGSGRCTVSWEDGMLSSALLTAEPASKASYR